MYRYCALILLLLLSPLSVFADKSDCLNHHCIAVIDAGSSGSRLRIYSYDLDKTNTPIQIKEIWTKRVVPGLSTIEHENRSIAVYMEKLFTDAPTVLMPVYFYSTAGMRLLPKMHQKNAIQLVAEWFDKQYYWRLVSARTINGREEGIFAWLATNYILNLLDQKEKPLVGVLDIGGASAQIVFPVNDETKTSNYDKVIINLYGQQHTLFSHSFLGLGQNEMGHQYFDLKSCYPQGFELPSGQLAEGNGLLCKSEISILVNAVHKVNKTVKPVLSLNPIEQWYLLGGLTHMLNDKILPISDQQFNLNNLFGFIDNNICQKNWVNLEELYPDHFILFNYCMLTSYMNALIVNGYGISSRKNIHFMTTNKTADWTIGVVLKHTQT